MHYLQFSYSSGVWKSKVKVLADSVWCLVGAVFLLGSLTVERARGLSEPSFTRALIPFLRAPPSQSKSLPGAHVQTPSPSGLGSTCEFWGGHIQTVQPTSVPSEDGKRQSRESICRRRPRSTLSPALTFHAPGDPPRAARAITTLSWEHHTLSFLVTRPPAARNDTPGRCPWRCGLSQNKSWEGSSYQVRSDLLYLPFSLFKWNCMVWEK